MISHIPCQKYEICGLEGLGLALEAGDPGAETLTPIAQTPARSKWSALIALHVRNSRTEWVRGALAVLTIVLLGGSALQAGTIVGTVRAEGKAEAEKDALC